MTEMMTEVIKNLNGTLVNAKDSKGYEQSFKRLHDFAVVYKKLLYRNRKQFALIFPYQI